MKKERERTSIIIKQGTWVEGVKNVFGWVARMASAMSVTQWGGSRVVKLDTRAKGESARRVEGAVFSRRRVRWIQKGRAGAMMMAMGRWRRRDGAKCRQICHGRMRHAHSEVLVSEPNGRSRLTSHSATRGPSSQVLAVWPSRRRRARISSSRALHRQTCARCQ